MVQADRRWTWADLARDVEQCARSLLAQGVSKGDRVACLSTPRPEFWISFLACARIGAIWVGLNPRHTLPELEHVVQDCAPKLLFALTAHRNRDFRADIDRLQTRLPGMQVVLFGGAGANLADFLACADQVHGRDLAAAEARVETQDPAAIVYTSGSTGRPKGALLPHRGLCFCSHLQARAWGARKGPTRIANYFPVNHLASLCDISCFCLVAGGTLVWIEDFDPGTVLETVERDRLTVLGGVPTMLQMMLEHPDYDRRDLSSLETIAIGGAAVPLPLVQTLHRRFAHVSTGYGSTETIGQMTFSAPGATAEQVAETIGLPVPEYALRIADPDGASCWPGEQGEIQVKGDFLFLGYHNAPAETAKAFTADGWYRTGDAAVARPDGLWRLVGRLKEAFKSGGYNIYPREIELALEDHPGITMAAVISVPDAKFGEVGHAYVLPVPNADPDEDSILAFCRDRLANYKLPKRVHVVADLPMLPVGKVDKPRLRRMSLTAATP